MANKQQIEILEQGDIYFFYRPKVQANQQHDVEPHAVEDVQRFYIVLKPHKLAEYRLLVMGRKRLPEAEAHEKYWATIDLVSSQSQEIKDSLKAYSYSTKTRGERIQPEARACGEGMYCIALSGRNSYLAYTLELPYQTGEVQEELNVAPEACYVLAIKNQNLSGVQGGKSAAFPKHLQEKFRDLRFIPVNQSDFLNYPGAELLLIGASADIKKELGIDLEPEHETFDSAEIFKQLKLWKNEHTIQPLFKGQWA